MKKNLINLIAVPVFIFAFVLLNNQKTEIALADTPVQPACPAGSMRLNFGDGSTTVVNGVATPADPWSPAPAPAPNPNPAPRPIINWDEYLDDEIINRYNNRRDNFRSLNEAFIFPKFTQKAYAQWRDEGEEGQPFTPGPACANFSQFRNSNNVAHLACIVMAEGGGGPFCLRQRDNAIFNGLTDNTCRQHNGTQLAGYRIVATNTNYACGIPSPVTDG